MGPQMIPVSRPNRGGNRGKRTDSFHALGAKPDESEFELGMCAFLSPVEIS